jgi:fluoroquinolone transport system permease protein
VLPTEILPIVLPGLIYSDPAGLGLFFIGGIIMLERRQGIINYLIVTPLLVKDFILSKVITLSTLAVVVSLIITYFSSIERSVNYIVLTTSTFFAANFFTTIGILIAINCSSLNEYFTKIIPWMILLSLPCLGLISQPSNIFISVFPSVASLQLVIGAFHGISFVRYFLLTTYLLIFNLKLISIVSEKFEEIMTIGG